jgi:hypothetical protein
MAQPARKSTIRAGPIIFLMVISPPNLSPPDVDTSEHLGRMFDTATMRAGVRVPRKFVGPRERFEGKSP